jgi:FeS assembly protein IscX
MQIYVREIKPLSALKWRYNGPDMLTWDDSYAIALALQEGHPDVHLEQVSLEMIYRWTLALPDFQDEAELANDAILSAIYQEWLEEINPI